MRGLLPTTSHSRTARLARLHRFDGMRPRDVRRIVRAGRLGRVRARQMITVQDGPSDGTYILLTGTAEVFLDGENIGTLVPGDLVGEIAVIAGQPGTASVEATCDLEVLHFFLSTSPTACLPTYRRSVVRSSTPRANAWPKTAPVGSNDQP